MEYNIINHLHNKIKDKFSVSPTLCNSANYSINLNNDNYKSLRNNLNLNNFNYNISNEEYVKRKNNNLPTNSNSNSKNGIYSSLVYSPDLNNKYSVNYTLNKSKFNSNILNNDTNLNSLSQLTPNNLNIDRNLKIFRRQKPGLKSDIEYEKGFNTKISQDSPDWFRVHNNRKLNEIDQQYKNRKEPLHVLSKFNRWITVTPNSKNRNRPLENVKLTSLENSKIIPNWMIVNQGQNPKQNDLFMPVQFQHFDSKTKQIILVDKDQKNAKKAVLFNYEYN